MQVTRKRVVLVVGLLAVVVAIAVIVVMVMRKDRLDYGPRNVLAWSHEWLGFASTRPARDAEALWNATKRDMGSEYDALDPNVRRSMRMLLAHQHLAEENFAQAFEHARAAWGGGVSRDSLLLIYLAVLARKMAWLEDYAHSQGSPTGPDEQLLSLVTQAGVFYAEGDYRSVLSVTSGEKWFRLRDASATDLKWGLWFGVWRALALRAQGKHDEAWAAVNTSGFMKPNALVGDMDLYVHLVLLFTELAEKAGDVESARTMAGYLETVLKIKDNVKSWEKYRSRLSHLRTRLLRQEPRKVTSSPQ